MKQFSITTGLLCLLLLLVFYGLYSPRGLFALQVKRIQTAELEQLSEQLRADNQQLVVQISSIQNNNAPLEGLARKRFGLIGKQEVFYFVDKQLLGSQLPQ